MLLYHGQLGVDQDEFCFVVDVHSSGSATI